MQKIFETIALKVLTEQLSLTAAADMLSSVGVISTDLANFSSDESAGVAVLIVLRAIMQRRESMAKDPGA